MVTEELRQMAQHLRLVAVDMVYKGKDGHPGPALSIADIVTTLFLIRWISGRMIQSGRIGPSLSCLKPRVSDLLRGAGGKRIFWRQGGDFKLSLWEAGFRASGYEQDKVDMTSGS